MFILCFLYTSLKKSDDSGLMMLTKRNMRPGTHFLPIAIPLLERLGEEIQTGNWDSLLLKDSHKQFTRTTLEQNQDHPNSLLSNVPIEIDSCSKGTLLVFPPNKPIR
jgi:hypothetical protein